MRTNAQELARFCSTCAKQAGLDTAGTAYSYKHLLAVEIPLPWPESMYSEPGVLPQELLDLRRLLIEAYERGETLSLGTLAIAPDKDYARPGFRRVISYQRPEQPYARFVQTEYLVPEALVGPLCWALLIDHAALPRFADMQQPSNTRDLLVCTHGAVDAACAKFGFPLYGHLRAIAADTGGSLRVWRASHFGGHVFAPTMLDMPAFRYWGFIEREHASALVERTGDTAHLRDCYRGWAGYDQPLLQVAERELLIRHGWDWSHYHQTGKILDQEKAATSAPDTEPSWAEVQIDFAAPDGSERGSYRARVERTKPIETIHSTGSADTYAYPQYIVTRLERVG